MNRSSKYSKRFIVFLAVILVFYYSTHTIIQLVQYNNVAVWNGSNNNDRKSLVENWRNLTEDQANGLSALGKFLLSPEGTNISKPGVDSSKEYLILVWKFGPYLERRHLNHFTEKTFSPWDNCSVSNCRLSYESEDADEADAILFHLHRIKGFNDLPENMEYDVRVKQRWVFLTDESPLHTFLDGNQRLANYNGIFNWSMTYRMDSDVPVPYGRTVLIEKGKKDIDENFLATKTKLVAIMGSNCGGSNERWNYVGKLKEILGKRLDIYGHCLGGDTDSCPGHFDTDCALLGAYKFYLSFENSNCREYLTEKVFWHGYQKHSVPIIMGASIENCRQILPPKSFIHVQDFRDPETLADYILRLSNDDYEYSKYHEWRKYFKVVNQHGYFKTDSRHYCRLCEALNYNDPSAKVYDDLELFWNPERDCW